MKTDYLLPHSFKKIGWILLIPFLFLGILFIYFGELSNIFILNQNWTDELLVIGLAVSGMMVAFSRERDEDEYTSSIRSRSMTLAFYVDLIVLIIATLTIYGINYLNFIAIQMFLILLLYIVLFNIAMWRVRKENKATRDE